MIALMLTNLCSPARQFHRLLLPLHVVIFHYNILVSRCLSHSVQGKTSFFCLIRRIFHRDSG